MWLSSLECLCVHTQSFSHVWLFATPWTVACQAPLSMGFSRQEYLNGLSFLLQGIFPTQNGTCVSFISCIGRQVLYQLSHQGSSMHCIIIPPLFFLTVEKKNKTKKWFFEKINKIGKTSARFTKKNSTQIKSEMKEMLQLMP